MHYELVSRALAYVSCLSTMSLLMTSMAIAAINVGRPSWPSCAPNTCVAGILVSKDGQFGALANSAQVKALAAKLWSAKACKESSRRNEMQARRDGSAKRR